MPEIPADPDTDAALRTLLLPFDGELLPRLDGRRVLLVNARAGAALPSAARHWALQQDSRPQVDALAGLGLSAAPDWPAGPFEAVLLLAPRQRQHGRALLAQALARVAPGGVLAACAGNEAGARSLQRDLSALAGPVRSLSKHHCRVSWTGPGATADPALASAWIAAAEPARVGGTPFLSQPGLFAWDRIDAASALLAAHLPADLQGRGADLGCGYGYLAAAVLARNPGVRALDLYEADARALALARLNLAAVPGGAAIRGFWHDVGAGLPESGYDFVVSNPPFHEGRADRPELGIAFIRAAAAALAPRGRLLLVANRHLPYEAALAQAFSRVRSLADAGGFKVFEATRA